MDTDLPENAINCHVITRNLSTTFLIIGFSNYAWKIRNILPKLSNKTRKNIFDYLGDPNTWKLENAKYQENLNLNPSSSG